MALRVLQDFINDAVQYLTAAFPQLNLSPGSVLSGIVSSFANTNFQLQTALTNSQNDGSVLTARGSALDALASDYGLFRGQPSFASGSVTLTRSDTSTVLNGFTGAKFSTSDPDLSKIVSFTATQPFSFPIGQAQAAVSVSCDISGGSGNVGIGTVGQILTPVVGVVSCINGASMTGGTDRETDDSLRQRIILSFAPQNTVGAIKSAILAVAGVATAAVFDQQDHLGNALAYAGDATGTLSTPLMQAVSSAVATSKSLGSNVTVLPPTVSFCNVNYTYAVQPGYNAATVKQTLESTINTYFSNLVMGQTFRPFDIVSLIIGANAQAYFVPGLLDFYITSTSLATPYIPKPWEEVKLGVLTGVQNTNEVS